MTTAPAAQALAEVAADGARVVMQGGNTGLVAGGVPEHGDVLLSTTRLNREIAAKLAVERALDPDGRLGRALLPFDGTHRPG